MAKTDPNEIGTKIKQACDRMQAMVCEDSKPETPKYTDLEISNKLGERAYPLRHRERLTHMQGPSLLAARSFLPRIYGGDCLLLIVGDRGPGKTQMATFWAAQRLRNGQSCGYYRKTMDLLGEIKQTWGDGGKSIGTENDVLNKYRRCHYLVLDEFHERGDSDWEGRTLVNIIDHRYDAMLATVLIANMAPAEVRFKVNPSIVSRAVETGGLIECDWESYRRAA